MLVSSRWLEGEARDRGISVEANEVEKTLEAQRKQSFPEAGDYKEYLESSGQTEQDLLMRVRLELLSSRIRAEVTKGDVKVTEQEIRRYYDRNRARFAAPERRDLRIVVTKTAAEAERAKAALAIGGSWKAVAKRRSIDTLSKSRGGKLLGVTAGQQDKALDAAIFAARKGTITGPVKTQAGYYVFEVTKVMPASQQTLSQAEATIEQLLLSERRQEQFDDFMKQLRDKWRDRTECRDAYATQECKNGPEVNPAPAQPSGVQQSAPQP
jgi:foldase protein PrsA